MSTEKPREFDVINRAETGDHTLLPGDAAIIFREDTHQIILSLNGGENERMTAAAMAASSIFLCIGQKDPRLIDMALSAGKDLLNNMDADDDGSSEN